jgi:hypothetical protein
MFKNIVIGALGIGLIFSLGCNVWQNQKVEFQKIQDLTNFTLKHTLRQNVDEKSILDKLCFRLNQATESFAWNKYSQDNFGIKNYKVENFGKINNSYSSWLEKPKAWMLTDLDVQLVSKLDF